MFVLKKNRITIGYTVRKKKSIIIASILICIERNKILHLFLGKKKVKRVNFLIN